MPPYGQLPLLSAATGERERVTDPGADYGEVFTRRWVVEFILDLVGYLPDQRLVNKVIVEPACGTGAFLVPIVERLLASLHGLQPDPASLGPCIRAFDLLEANAERARKAITHTLTERGIDQSEAERLAITWVSTGDFLLGVTGSPEVDFVVGNPPYIRLENVPRAVTAAYRNACPTMQGRADIYVGFIERGLDLLRSDGALGFICADRWMRNQYGAALRRLISDRYAVDTVVSMHDVDAFEDDVSAYPAICVIRRSKSRAPVVANTSGTFGEGDAARLAAWRRQPRPPSIRSDSFEASRLRAWFGGGDLWPTGTPAQIGLVAELERRFPALEDVSTGTVVGIGVATGCDEVYITEDARLVERSRLLPLIRARDVSTGTVNWSGGYLVNPWNGDGLVDLDKYPRLAGYLMSHSVALKARHVARRRPEAWYRTIDRVDDGVLRRPKLLLPDLKARIHPVLDDGAYYPHHNLYYVTSRFWDPEVLGGLLLSEIANLFVGTYCVRMRGGCYRFQAQYLRRIRVPAVDSIRASAHSDLAAAFRGRDIEKATMVAAKLYGVDIAEVRASAL